MGLSLLLSLLPWLRCCCDIIDLPATGHGGGGEDGVEGSVGLAQCQERCGSPPQPSCTSEQNWWDLFSDTGQHNVPPPGCDDEACPYPLEADCLEINEEKDCSAAGCVWNGEAAVAAAAAGGGEARCTRSRCNPHPFCCCDCERTSGSACWVWHGVDTTQCPSFPEFEMGWENGEGPRCKAYCQQRRQQQQHGGAVATKAAGAMAEGER